MDKVDSQVVVVCQVPHKVANLVEVKVLQDQAIVLYQKLQKIPVIKLISSATSGTNLIKNSKEQL